MAEDPARRAPSARHRAEEAGSRVAPQPPGPAPRATEPEAPAAREPARPALPEDAEGRWARLQRLGRDVAGRLRHRAELSRVRARVSRLEAAVEEEKTRVGRALYPLVEEARITVELPQVQEGVERIAHLREEIRRFREELEELEGSEEA